MVFLAALAASSCRQADEPDEGPVADPLTMSDYRFTPQEFSEAAGRQLTLRIANKDKLTHNFSVPVVPIDLDFRPGQTRTVIFVAPDSVGPVEFFCKIHRDRGMRGTVRVLPASVTTPTTP